MKRKLLIYLIAGICIFSGCAGGETADSNGSVTGDLQTAESAKQPVTENTLTDENESGEFFVPRLDERAVTNTISDEVKNKAALMPTASYDSLPDWYGTTIFNRYEYGWTGSDNLSNEFDETTVQEISDIGFNFVRVLIDTRFFYTEEVGNPGPHFDGDSERVNLNVLKNLDDLITWCIERDIHVCLDVHNTPGGYMIGGDEEASRELLFTEGSAEEQIFFDYWDLISRRYKDISTNALSFNLYNEPPDFVEDEQYTAFVKKLLEIVWDQNENRLVFVDMLKYAREPVYGLVGEKIVQCFHVYEPYDFTHCNQDRLFNVYDGDKPEIIPYPVLPVSCTLYSENSYTIHGDFPARTRLYVDSAMGEPGGEFIVKYDGKEVYRQSISESFIAENGLSIFSDEYGGRYYNSYEEEKDPVRMKIIADDEAKEIEFIYISKDGGDGWFEINDLVVETDKVRTKIHSVWLDDVQMPPADITIDPDTGIYTLNTAYDENDTIGRDDMEERIRKYYDFSVETGTPVMMQETGDIVFTDTPSTVRYLDDVISTCEKYGIGWVIYSHDGVEFSYVAVEDKFRRINGNYEEINPGRYIETNIRDLFESHIYK